MKKVIWSDVPLDQSTAMREVALERGRERGGLDAARGLIIGLAISQLFWLVLAACVVLFWTHRI
jgi:hypothetical protein